MSTYQYYEFLAIDQPLSSQETAALRSLSTRARITPVSMTNEYHWCNFGGDPDELVRLFFDAHVYVANWGAAVFMARLPREALDVKLFKPFEVDHILEYDVTPTHCVVSWRLEDSEEYDRFSLVDDGQGWMTRLAPVREELLQGDLRSLYIGWLSAVSRGLVEDEDLEPPLLADLGQLTAAQSALAEFLAVDKDLRLGAGLDRHGPEVFEPTQAETDAWIEALPRPEVLELLRQLLAGQGPRAAGALRSRYAAWRNSLQTGEGELPRRTVAQLRLLAESAQVLRLAKEKAEREQAELERRKQREKYLSTLVANASKAWCEVERSVSRGSGLGYDEACAALVDLAEAHSLQKRRSDFDRDMARFMTLNDKRKALVERLVKAGLWPK